MTMSSRFTPSAASWVATVCSSAWRSWSRRGRRAGSRSTTWRGTEARGAAATIPLHPEPLSLVDVVGARRRHRGGGRRRRARAAQPVRDRAGECHPTGERGRPKRRRAGRRRERARDHHRVRRLPMPGLCPAAPGLGADPRPARPERSGEVRVRRAGVPRPGNDRIVAFGRRFHVRPNACFIRHVSISA